MTLTTPCPPPPRPAPAPTPAGVSEAISAADTLLVLQHFGYHPPGRPDQTSNFRERLVALIAGADTTHRRHFARAYPALVAAVQLARSSPTGIDTLHTIANHRHPATDRSPSVYPDYDSPRRTGPYLDIHTEREEQKTKLGTEEHTLQEWVLALVEDIGSLAESVLAATRADGTPHTGLDAVRQEAVHAGAGLLALIEHIDTLQASST
ncbi:hypothetical protein [Streptomyces cylindrosporus]|uniref:Uncharacterized protein n=1 Tax=Streptomyces cylindrosporus TaxID=2927583 RepID=A0ABS9YK85_9ACTN|nr:hypothetical protein [Streptomyces cylindrosporus]MCI3277575.1 hypothetical protein [Streptomyces cylindrosporus]